MAGPGDSGQQGSEAGLAGTVGRRRRPVVMTIVFVALGLAVGLAVFPFWRYYSGQNQPPADFPMVVDIPIEDPGYGVLRISTETLSDPELVVEGADGIALVRQLHDEATALVADEPLAWGEVGSTPAGISCRYDLCAWEVYVAHPVEDSVRVTLRLSGYGAEGDPEPYAIERSDPLPPARVESIDVSLSVPADGPGLAAVTLSAVADSQVGRWWEGQPSLVFDAFERFDDCSSPCPIHRHSTFMLLEEPISGTLTVLSVDDGAAPLDLRLETPVGWVTETLSGEDRNRSTAAFVIETASGFDPHGTALVAEISGTSRGQDAQTYQLEVHSNAPFGTDYSLRFGGDRVTRYAAGDCRATRCSVGDFSAWMVPYDWTATFHWAYFGDAIIPNSAPSKSIALKDQ